MKKLFFFLVVLVLTLPVILLAAEPIEIDPVVVNTILNGGVIGFSVVMLTQLIKTKLKIQGPFVFVISLVVSIFVSALYFIMIVPPFAIMKAIGYGVTVWAVFNGWYKFKTA